MIFFLTGILVATDEQAGVSSCPYKVKYSNILVVTAQSSYTSTAAKMGACLGQETAHKASLDSFLGNHNEVIFVLCHW